MKRDPEVSNLRVGVVKRNIATDASVRTDEQRKTKGVDVKNDKM